MEREYYFIGGGNIAQALIGGLLKNQQKKPQITVIDISKEAREKCFKLYGVSILSGITSALSKADVVVLAVKPDDIKEVSLLLKNQIRPNCLVISVAAGIKINTLANYFNKNTSIIRAMPNTPALVNAGTTVITKNFFVNQDQREIATILFRNVGEISWINDEDLMDAVTAISGSGPAYFFLFTEILEKAGVNLGLPENLSKELTRNTFIGSATLVKNSDKSLTELRKNVTSKGGTTEAALGTLEKLGLREMLRKATEEAMKKSKVLSRKPE